MLMAKAIAFRNAANKIVDNYSESELLVVIIKRIVSIYGANKLLMFKKNVERDLSYAYKDYENKKKEALEYQKKAEKIPS